MLTEDNFQLWIESLKAVLLSKGLWKITTKGPQEETKDETKTLQSVEKAFGLIYLSIPQRMYYIINVTKEPKEALEALHAHFESTSQANKRIIKRQWNNYQMSPDHSISTHVSKITELTNKMKAVGLTLTEEEQRGALLGTLCDAYKVIRTTLELQHDLSYA